MQHASYRKYNDGSLNSSKYHKKDGTPVRAILEKDLMEQSAEDKSPILATVFESYERNGDGFVMFNTQESAENHDLFESDRVVKTQVWLSPEGYANLIQGKPVF